MLVLLRSAPTNNEGLAGDAMDNESDNEGQEGSGGGRSQPSTPREKLLSEWQHELYNTNAYDEWVETHLFPPEDMDHWDSVEVMMQPRFDIVDFQGRSPAFHRFLKYTEDVRVKLSAAKRMERHGVGHHAGSTLDQIEDVEALDLLPDVIPAGELTVAYGPPKAGKSAWAHKLSICASSIDADFDGEPIMHGRVLFVTLDPGARKAQVKRRMMQIYERLGIDRHDDRLILVDDVVFLDDPLSVNSLLKKNPGQFVLVVIDPLYKALSNGDPSVASVMVKATEGMKTICSATGAAVLILHHDTKSSGEMFGSVFLKAALDSQLYVERNKDAVTVTVEVVKNGEPRATPFVYRIDGAFLESAETRTNKKSAQPDATITVLRPDMLALVPTEWTTTAMVYKLVAHLLRGATASAKKKEWERVRQSWEAAGLVAQNAKTRSMRRVAEDDE